MKLTLLCGANPLIAKRGPVVRLQAGRWKLQCDKIKDSSLVLTLESPSLIKERMSVQHEAEFTLDSFTLAWVDWINRGRESHVSIFAEKVD